MQYPRQLRPPLIDGYALESAQDVLRTDMDSGLARVRPRHGTPPMRITAQWRLTPAQAVPLVAWLYAAARAWQVMPATTPDGGAVLRVRRLGPYQAGIEAGLVRVQASFEALPYAETPMTHEHWRALTAYGEAEIVRAAVTPRWAAGHYPTDRYF